jgi:hypothetical protein
VLHLNVTSSNLRARTQGTNAETGGTFWIQEVLESCLLAANHLVLVVLASEGLEGRLDDSTAEAEDEVEGRLLLDVVVSQGTAVLQLLAGEDQTLLVRRDA